MTYNIGLSKYRVPKPYGAIPNPSHNYFVHFFFLKRDESKYWSRIRNTYLRSWFVCPQLFFRQFVARGGRRA